MTVESTTQMLLLLFFTVLAVFGGDNAVAQDTPSIIITPFIAGGEETDIRIYPFIVSIQHKMHHKCGGVIVNKNVVLTAAHCIRSSSHDMAADTNEWEVIAGRSNLLNNKEGQRLKVQSTKTHPDYTYNRTVLLNDIGLIWLKRRFVWSDSVQPANLSQTWNIDVRPFVSYFASYVVTTIGWGRLQDSGPLPGLLQHVNQTINIGDGDNCFDTLQSEDIRSSYGSIMFCTSDKGKDACEGDSGGPVVYNDEVVGIVSHGYGGKGCEIDIGWKIKVSTYYSWIKEELKRGPSTEKKRIFCYYGSFVRKLDIEDIDPFLCTDIIYAFAGLDSNNRVFSLNKDIDLYDSGGKGGFKRITSLKESNPLLKTWISIGGWEEGSLKYSKMVSETTSRAVFIESVVVFLQKYGFDGVDIHWLYPGMRGGLSTDRIFFVLLLRELRGSLDEHGLLLSVAVGSAKTQVPIAYNIPEISSSVHYIVLLTHSYHGDWENFTGINAPLYPQETDKSEVDLYDNVNWTVNHWIAHKAEREKLIIGIATFGRNWILEDPMDHSVGSKASKSSVTNGFMSYSEICLNVLNGWQEVNDNFTKSPYAFFENQWVSYDNPWSVGIKSNFINELELGGAAVWSLENDDFLNLCGNGKSPLTNTIKQILGAVFKGPSAEKKRIFCYYGSWSLYRHYYGKLDIENIDPFLCTDIIYAFAGLDSNNRVFSLNKDIDLYDSGGKGGFKRFTSLKESNPLLKTWISIGGWEEGSSKYSKMVSETTSRAVFVESVVEFLQKYGFDGVDIHWLYPGMRGGSRTDTVFFGFLLRELRESFDKHGLLLSVATGNAKEQILLSYNIPEISSLVHYIILLTHSYHGDWEKFTGLNAPLYPQETDISEVDLYKNANWTVNHWIANKAERKKLIMGIAAFGRSWILEDPMDHSVGSAATSGTNPTIISKQNGFLSYSEICLNVLNGWQEVNDSFTKSPYAFFESQWVGYDNPWSVGIKSNFINELGLGGAAVWSLENDDFLNLCGNGKSPLTNTIKQVLGAVVEDTSVSEYPFNNEPEAISTPILTENIQEICGVSRIRTFFGFPAWMGGNSINNTDPGQGNNTSSSIVGGSEALVGSHPWMALIIQDFYPLCGGALITNKHVLTAANCVQLEGIYKVRLGEYNQDDETDPDVIEIPVEKVVIHPKYIQRRTGFKNDIAILVLTNRVVFTDRIVPICLPDGELRETELTNGNVILSGWGSVSSGDEYPSILQEANLNTVEQEDCLKVWKGITEEQICAQAPGNGFCVGDIGGPLTQVIAENGRYYLLGLLSFGRKGKCADAKYPGVFTRITSYLDWIKENIRNN